MCESILTSFPIRRTTGVELLLSLYVAFGMCLYEYGNHMAEVLGDLTDAHHISLFAGWLDDAVELIRLLGRLQDALAQPLVWGALAVFTAALARHLVAMRGRRPQKFALLSAL